MKVTEKIDDSSRTVIINFWREAVLNPYRGPRFVVD